ncbi:MAG: photosystem II stability/assembly factor-like protein [Algoriphagus sp.]|nr:photosystem II stability/assembly factor-like protein [Algoriphagus sp.]
MSRVNQVVYLLLQIGIIISVFSCQSPREEEITSSPTGWKVFETPIEASLRGLSPVSENIVWASGSRGTWLKTLDGGESWESGIVAGLDSVDFRSIYAFDEEQAIVVAAGQPAHIYKTMDGGKTWELKLEASSDAFFDGISFVDESRGYVFGDPVDGFWMIYETTDKGDTWNLLDSLPAAEVGEAGFAASASSMLASGEELWLGSGGSYSFLHYSPDRGKTWLRHPTPLIQGESSQGVFSLCKMKEELVLAGGDYLMPDVNKGNWGIFSITQKEWMDTSTSSPGGYRSGVTFWVKGNYLIAVGPSGSDFSENEGGIWKTFSEEGFHAVSASRSGQTVWASGSGGRVAKLLF